MIGDQLIIHVDDWNRCVCIFCHCAVRVYNTCSGKDANIPENYGINVKPDKNRSYKIKTSRFDIFILTGRCGDYSAESPAECV